MKLIEDFNEISSLEFLTATQFIINIWNRADIMRSITQAINNDVDGLEIDDQVLEILWSIQNFPTILKVDMRHIIRPIGNHIKVMRKFANFSPYLESFHREFSVDQWTPYGTVDVKRLDKILVEDSGRNIGFRFTLACYDCFEENITELFPLLTYGQRQRLKGIKNKGDMRIYWTHRITRNVPQNPNLPILPYVCQFSFDDKSAFKLTLRNGNKSGIEYFMNKLEHQECLDVIRENFKSLVQRFGNIDAIPIRCEEHDSDALYFVLSSLVERKSFIGSSYYFDILHKFLRYPFFGLFNRCRAEWVKDLSLIDTSYLLSRIANLKALGTHFFGYELFDDFWHNLSDDLRRHIENTFDLEDSDDLDEALYEEIVESNRREI